jgi:hypothetical protein
VAEIVYADVLLHAVAKSDRIKMKTWKYVTGLPSLCKKESFLCNDVDEPSNRPADQVHIVCQEFENFDTTVTLDSFIKTLYGDKLIAYIPLLLRSALINAYIRTVLGQPLIPDTMPNYDSQKLEK